MVRHGILKESERVELLEGSICLKMAHDPHGSIAIENSDHALRLLLPASWRIRIQLPITTQESEPEPDIVICTPVEQRQGRHPEPKDIPLVIEVADSSLQEDRTIKQRIYPGGSIPVYWIVDVNQRQVEVYTDPSGPSDEPRYRGHHDYKAEDSVPLVILGQEVGLIPVSSLLP